MQLCPFVSFKVFEIFQGIKGSQTPPRCYTIFSVQNFDAQQNVKEFKLSFYTTNK